MSMGKRLFGNISAHLFGLGVQILSQLITVPFFLFYWGAPQYGEWLILSSIPSILAMADLGLGTVGANKMAMYSAGGNFSKVSAVVGSMMVFMISLSFCIFLGTLVILYLIPINEILNLNVITKNECNNALLWLSGYSLLNILGSLTDGLYRVNLRSSRGVYLWHFGRLFVFLISLLSVSRSRNTANLAAMMFIAQLSVFIIIFFDVKKIHTNLLVDLVAFNKQEFLTLLKPSMSYLLFPLGNAAYFQGMSLVVYAAGGAVLVVVFNTTRTLTRLISQMMIVIKSSVWPEFSKVYAERDFEKVKQLLVLTLLSSFSLSFLASLVMILFGPWLLRIWTGGSVELTHSQLSCFMIGVVFNTIWFSCSALIKATNNHEGLAVRFCLASILSLPVTYFLTVQAGVSGAAFAIAITEFMLIPYTLNKVKEITNSDFKELFSSKLICEYFSILYKKSIRNPNR